MKTLQFLPFMILFFSSVKANAQETELAGRRFAAAQGQTCKSMTEGGCMLSFYRIMEFDADSVLISWRVEASCTPVEKEAAYEKMYDHLSTKHKWTVENDVLRMEGSEEFETLTISPGSLSGMKKSAGAEEGILFREELK